MFLIESPNLGSFNKDILIVKKLLVSTVKTPMHYNNSLIQFTAFVSLTELLLNTERHLPKQLKTTYFHNFLSFTAYLAKKMQYTNLSKNLLFSKIFFNFIKIN